jgi:hypothetical protein
MKKTIALLLVGLLIGGLCWLAASYLKIVPITLDTADAYDICGTRSMINQSEVNLLAKPSKFSKPKLTLSKNQMVNVCQERDGWSGIIVANLGKQDCQIAAGARSGTRQYKGPCDFGWVPNTTLQMFAG